MSKDDAIRSASFQSRTLTPFKQKAASWNYSHQTPPSILMTHNIDNMTFSSNFLFHTLVIPCIPELVPIFMWVSILLKCILGKIESEMNNL